MSVAVASMMRDSQCWAGHHIGQAEKFFKALLPQHPGLTFFVAEGNSRDDTRAVLEWWRAELPGRVNILDHQVSGSEVASVVSDARFKNLSAVGNTALRAARDSGAEFVLWMESDLVPPPDLLPRLLKWAEDPQWHRTLAIAPVPVFTWQTHKQFYDTWAFEGARGERWANGDLLALKAYHQPLRPMRSIGSCALLNGRALNEFGLDFSDGCFPALCEGGRRCGFGIYVDTTLEITHPSGQFVNGRLI